MTYRLVLSTLAVLCVLAGAISAEAKSAKPPREVYGTLEPFASQAVYFVVTDRFVDGDPSNDHREKAFDIPTPGAPEGETDNIGYLGGDFKGVLDHADYIKDMGFTSVWITPIVDNPDEPFTGGDPVRWGSMLTDRGKSGYHGYWGDNFYALDEHLPSEGLDFRAFTKGMKSHGLDVVLDIVCNHGSPAFGMPVKQPKFGQIFDANGKLVADHANLPPEKLDPEHEPLQRFYKTELELAQLSNLDENNPAVLDYLAGAYEQWIEQGAAAFRVDTIRLMPVDFWERFAARIRAKHPGFFMFGEAFDYDAKNIAPFTWAKNGGYSVLDFPLKGQLAKVFGKERAGYEAIEPALYLKDGPYKNPYELATFYDNHDMARLDADDDGFVDAHNFLFTARGIPVVYYGSEIGFMRGRAEHAGNRNYFGVERIEQAKTHRIHDRLKRIATLRAKTPALQRGLQTDLEMKGDRAAFVRQYQHAGVHQTALVLLNKGDAATSFDVPVQRGRWRDAFGGSAIKVAKSLKADVAPHDVRVFLLDAPL